MLTFAIVQCYFLKGQLEVDHRNAFKLAAHALQVSRPTLVIVNFAAIVQRLSSAYLSSIVELR